VTTAATGELSAPSIGELELVPFSVGDDPTAQGRIALPVSAETGSAGTVVVLEVDPGNRLDLPIGLAEPLDPDGCHPPRPLVSSSFAQRPQG